MPTTRSYDIILTKSAEADLADMGGDARRCLRQLHRLRDDDMYYWERLPLPRGDEGSWVKLPLCKRVVMAQYARASRRRLYFGPRRGRLKVVRIVAAAVLEAVLLAAAGEGEEDQS